VISHPGYETVPVCGCGVDARDKRNVKGDEIFVRETPEGFEVSPFDPAFKEAMEAAASIAKEYKNALRTLAQK
jgi:hypothetical protein